MHKKNIFKFFVLSFTLYAILKLLSIYLFEYTEDKVRTAWQIKSQISQNFTEQESADIIIGSSRSLALNPIQIEKITNVKVVNLSAASGTIPHVYYTLLRLVQSGKKINTVYIDIPASNNMHRDTDSTPNDKIVRFFLNEQELQDYSRYVPNAVPYYNDTRKFGKNYVNKDLYKIFTGYIKHLLGKNANDTLQRSLLETRGFMFIGDPHTKSSKKQAFAYRQIVANLTTGDVPKVHLLYLKRILALLEQEHIQYKFFFSPYPSVSKKISNLGLGNYVHLLKLIPKENRDVDPLILDEDFFIDGSHVNKAGSEKFTKYFIQEIMRINLKEKFETYPINYDSDVHQ